MQNGDEASPSIISVVQGFFSENAHNSRNAWYILIKFCIGLLIHFNIVYTGMQNSDEASSSISQAGRGKKLITLEPHVKF